MTASERGSTAKSRTEKSFKSEAIEVQVSPPSSDLKIPRPNVPTTSTFGSGEVLIERTSVPARAAPNLFQEIPLSRVINSPSVVPA